MEEEAHKDRSIYRPMKVITWPGVSLHFEKELVSLLGHFPFPNLPSVATRTGLHSAEEASRTGFEPQHDFRQVSSGTGFIRRIDWWMYLFRGDPKACGQQAPCAGWWLWRLNGSWYTQNPDLVLSVAFNFLPRGCGLQARCTVPSLAVRHIGTQKWCLSKTGSA